MLAGEPEPFKMQHNKRWISMRCSSLISTGLFCIQQIHQLVSSNLFFNMSFNSENCNELSAQRQITLRSMFSIWKNKDYQFNQHQSKSDNIKRTDNVKRILCAIAMATCLSFMNRLWKKCNVQNFITIKEINA